MNPERESASTARAGGTRSRDATCSCFFRPLWSHPEGPLAAILRLALKTPPLTPDGLGAVLAASGRAALSWSDSLAVPSSPSTPNATSPPMSHMPRTVASPPSTRRRDTWSKEVRQATPLLCFSLCRGPTPGTSARRLPDVLPHITRGRLLGAAPMKPESGTTALQARSPLESIPSEVGATHRTHGQHLPPPVCPELQLPVRPKHRHAVRVRRAAHQGQGDTHVHPSTTPRHDGHRRRRTRPDRGRAVRWPRCRPGFCLCPHLCRVRDGDLPARTGPHRTASHRPGGVSVLLLAGEVRSGDFQGSQISSRSPWCRPPRKASGVPPPRGSAPPPGR